MKPTLKDLLKDSIIEVIEGSEMIYYSSDSIFKINGDI